MPNYFEGGKPVCPYYMGAGLYYVHCGNPGKPSDTCLQFSGKTALKRHLTQVCGSFYYKSRCPMAQQEAVNRENRLKELCMERIVLARRSAVQAAGKGGRK